MAEEELEEGTPTFYTVLPAEIRYAEDLSSTEKIILSELVLLSNGKGHCWVSNKYLSRVYKLDRAWAYRIISSLQRQGYIKVVKGENDYGENKRKIYLTDKTKKPYLHMSKRKKDTKLQLTKNENTELQVIEKEPTVVSTPQSVDFKPQTVVFKPQTVDFKPQDTNIQVDFKPQTVVFKPQTVDFKPQTVDFKPQTVVFKQRNIIIQDNNTSLIKQENKTREYAGSLSPLPQAGFQSGEAQKRLTEKGGAADFEKFTLDFIGYYIKLTAETITDIYQIGYFRSEKNREEFRSLFELSYGSYEKEMRGAFEEARGRKPDKRFFSFYETLKITLREKAEAEAQKIKKRQEREERDRLDRERVERELEENLRRIASETGQSYEDLRKEVEAEFAEIVERDKRALKRPF